MLNFFKMGSYATVFFNFLRRPLKETFPVVIGIYDHRNHLKTAFTLANVLLVFMQIQNGEQPKYTMARKKVLEAFFT